MMEGSDYLEDEPEPLFPFDNEDDDTAAVNHIDERVEPLTPYGSVQPAATHAHAAGAAAGRLHLSSAQIWQRPEPEPEPEPEPAEPEPPALSYSPSPRATSVFHSRQQDSRRHLYRSCADSTQPPVHRGSEEPPGQLVHRPSVASVHHHDLQQLDGYYKDQQTRSQDQTPQILRPRTRDSSDPGPAAAAAAPDGDPEGYEMIAEDEVLEMMYNGDEESRVTAEKLKAQVVSAAMHNGKVVYMVGQATAQWWWSPEMAKRRRAASRKMLDLGGAVLSGAGNAIMHKTPLGRVCESITVNVSAFKAAPLTYTMRGLGVMKTSNAAAPSALPAGDVQRPPQDGFSQEPAIVDDFDDAMFDEFEEGEVMGMGGMFEDD